MANRDLPGPEAVYTISQITRLIKTELEAAFPNPVWVVGEISNFSRAHSGHLYFDLKDQDSQLRSVMWRAYAARVPFEPESGQQVVCKGQINVYERRGQYQFQVEVMEPKGKGALQLAFEQLKEKLREEGLFAEEIKKRLPAFPRKIGIVTSPRGAAIVDILRTLERRFARLRILIYPVKVQGDGAPEEIVEGIAFFSSQADIDVLIVGRGGGSLEDLWAFNDERVARAIHRCPIPVISAVGHEVDYTIADFVADFRASTPTAAAEMVIEEEEALQQKIQNLRRRLAQSLLLAAREQKNRVLRLANHRAFQDLRLRVLSLAQGVDELEQRAAQSIRRQSLRIREIRSRAQLLDERVRNRVQVQMQARQALWERLCAELHTLSPLNVLKKGYTVCWGEDDRTLVRNVEDVRTGDQMTVSFHLGEFRCRVSEVDETATIEDRLRKAGIIRDGAVDSEGRPEAERTKR